MSKQTVGMLCCVLMLVGCVAESKPVVDAARPRSGAEVAKPLPPPPHQAVPDRSPSVNPAHSTPTDMMPTKGELDQQVDPNKLRQNN
jgi:hypothetical protein